MKSSFHTRKCCKRTVFLEDGKLLCAVLDLNPVASIEAAFGPLFGYIFLVSAKVAFHILFKLFNSTNLTNNMLMT
ncbi:hypothetical protein HanXRQr2_Chr03g0114941 [Helianthus annuus]|uniref:Uncharacterized protein n=1 Tax=Helianthus annuus TaxID=4232 RepID=A0A9K3JGV6_HELAN|nr:hypothetical protein HanXRQr2_Chr03g0114941 [Helianthus annuus]KAJ0944013.1 hypothetical protein HanPSC8_Chr03g0111311 [Helianthus annuus]